MSKLYTSTNIELPYLFEAQAQKHVTHNDALAVLDTLVHLAVLDRDLATPPLALDEGARYLVASPATDDWTGQDGDIAAWQDGVWRFHKPQPGWRMWVADEAALLIYDGATWTALGGGGNATVNPTPLVGINAVADSVNRLSVSSPNVLFNHEGDDARVKVNKALAGDTASHLFQTNFSGRAEIGLTGDDNFRLKVSADGAAWNDALVVDRATGEVVFPNTSLGGSGAGGTNPSLLINGDFGINQRAFAGGALTAGSYGHDRIRAGVGGANYSVASDVITLNSGELEQVIEVPLWQLGPSLASTQVTVSVYDPSADLTVTVGSVGATIQAGAGQRSVTLVLGAGDVGNLTAKIKRAAAGVVTFRRWKVEAGATATPWQSRPVELALCQRYYYRSDLATGALVMYGYNVAGSTPQQTFPHPGPMRAAPTRIKLGTWTVSNCGQPTIHVADRLFWGAYVTVATTGAFACLSSGAGAGVAFDAEF